MDEDREYSAKQLDVVVVNPNQIRLIIRTAEPVNDHTATVYDTGGVSVIIKNAIVDD